MKTTTPIIFSERVLGSKGKNSKKDKVPEAKKRKVRLASEDAESIALSGLPGDTEKTNVEVEDHADSVDTNVATSTKELSSLSDGDVVENTMSLLPLKETIQVSINATKKIRSIVLSQEEDERTESQSAMERFESEAPGNNHDDYPGVQTRPHTNVFSRLDGGRPPDKPDKQPVFSRLDILPTSSSSKNPQQTPVEKTEKNKKDQGNNNKAIHEAANKGTKEQQNPIGKEKMKEEISNKNTEGSRREEIRNSRRSKSKSPNRRHRVDLCHEGRKQHSRRLTPPRSDRVRTEDRRESITSSKHATTSRYGSNQRNERRKQRSPPRKERRYSPRRREVRKRSLEHNAQKKLKREESSNEERNAAQQYTPEERKKMEEDLKKIDMMIQLKAEKKKNKAILTSDSDQIGNVVKSEKQQNVSVEAVSINLAIHSGENSPCESFDGNPEVPKVSNSHAKQITSIEQPPVKNRSKMDCEKDISLPSKSEPINKDSNISAIALQMSHPKIPSKANNDKGNKQSAEVKTIAEKPTSGIEKTTVKDSSRHSSISTNKNDVTDEENSPANAREEKEKETTVDHRSSIASKDKASSSNTDCDSDDDASSDKTTTTTTDSSSDDSSPVRKRKSKKKQKKKKSRRKRDKTDTESDSDNSDDDGDSDDDSDGRKSKKRKRKRKKRKKSKNKLKRKRRKSEKDDGLVNSEQLALIIQEERRKMKEEILKEIQSMPGGIPNFEQPTPKVQNKKVEDEDDDSVELDYSSEEDFDQHGFRTGIPLRKDSSEIVDDAKAEPKKDEIVEVFNSGNDILDLELEEDDEETNWKRQKKEDDEKSSTAKSKDKDHNSLHRSQHSYRRNKSRYTHKESDRRKYVKEDQASERRGRSDNKKMDNIGKQSSNKSDKTEQHLSDRNDRKDKNSDNEKVVSDRNSRKDDKFQSKNKNGNTPTGKANNDQHQKSSYSSERREKNSKDGYRPGRMNKESKVESHFNATLKSTSPLRKKESPKQRKGLSEERESKTHMANDEQAKGDFHKLKHSRSDVVLSRTKSQSADVQSSQPIPSVSLSSSTIVASSTATKTSITQESTVTHLDGIAIAKEVRDKVFKLNNFWNTDGMKRPNDTSSNLSKEQTTEFNTSSNKQQSSTKNASDREVSKKKPKLTDEVGHWEAPYGKTPSASNDIGNRLLHLAGSSYAVPVKCFPSSSGDKHITNEPTTSQSHQWNDEEEVHGESRMDELAHHSKKEPSGNADPKR